MAGKKYEEKYTKPKLRQKIKEEIKKSSKGGKKGQWSARKSQLLVQEYEKKGGGYKGEKNDEQAKSLKEWTDQEWQTKNASGKARSKGKTKRYLPKKVWDLLSEKDRKEAEKIKEEASKKGKQKVEWTPAIIKAFKKAGFSDKEEKKKKLDFYKKAKELNIQGRSKMGEKQLEKALYGKLTKEYNQKNKQDIYEEARKKNISNRSSMSKKQLIEKLIKTDLQ